MSGLLNAIMYHALLISSKAEATSPQTNESAGVCEDSRYWEQDARAEYMQKYGSNFNSCTASFAVAQLKNRDESSHRWTVEQVTVALRPHGVTLSDKTKWNAYYVANMLYSDYFDGAAITEASILKMASYKLNDPDAKEGDIYTEWEAKMMNHCTSINYSTMIE